MKDARPGKPVIREHVSPGPGLVALLAASAKHASPSFYHPVPEPPQGTAIGRHSVISIVSADDLLEPLPLLADRLVHPLTQFPTDFLELRPHAVTPGLPMNEEVALAGFSADEGESEEIEGFRFVEPAPPAVFRRETPELYQPGLLRVERQSEFPHPLTQQIQEAPGVGLVLKADDKSSRPGRVRGTARATLGEGLAVSAFPLYVPV